MIGYFGLGAGIVTLVALFIRFGINFSSQMKDYNNDSKVESIMTFFLFNFPHKKIDDKVSGNTNSNLTDPKTLIAKNIVQGNVNTESKYLVDYKDNNVVISKI